MKILELSILLMTILISCKSDDNNNNDDINNNLIGNWSQLTEFENGINFTNECLPLNTIEFRNDGTGTNVDYDFVVSNGQSECVFDYENEFSWSTDDNNINSSFIEDGVLLESNFIFTIQNDILTFDSDEGDESVITTFARI